MNPSKEWLQQRSFRMLSVLKQNAVELIYRMKTKNILVCTLRHVQRPVKRLPTVFVQRLTHVQQCSTFLCSHGSIFFSTYTFHIVARQYHTLYYVSNSTAGTFYPKWRCAYTLKLKYEAENFSSSYGSILCLYNGRFLPCTKNGSSISWRNWKIWTQISQHIWIWVGYSERAVKRWYRHLLS